MCFSGALFLDGGIELADRVFGQVLFDAGDELLQTWMSMPPHPLQVISKIMHGTLTIWFHGEVEISWETNKNDYFFPLLLYRPIYRTPDTNIFLVKVTNIFRKFSDISQSIHKDGFWQSLMYPLSAQLPQLDI